MQTNLEKLKQAFADQLGVETSEIGDELAYGNHGWDSLAHMALVAAIEQTFDIMMETTDVVEMNNFRRAAQIVSAYGVSM